jgi:hypothetical protein
MEPQKNILIYSFKLRRETAGGEFFSITKPECSVIAESDNKLPAVKELR